jgi:nucleosome binding factor SPN SPT16 subunit
MISDTVCITTMTADVLTKMGKNITDVAYNIYDERENEDDDEDDEDDDDDENDEDDKDATKADAKLARKLAAQGTSVNGGVRKSSRLEKDPKQQQEASDGIAERERKQIALMNRRNEERIRELARANRNANGDDGRDDVEELETYKRTRDYPDFVLPNQVKVDMASQCVFLPICGNPIPFHISTIKNVVMPEADGATLLRINFYTAGTLFIRLCVIVVSTVHQG